MLRITCKYNYVPYARFIKSFLRLEAQNIGIYSIDTSLQTT